MYKSEVKGKGGIVARVVAYSKSAMDGKEICTMEVEYPRFIHSEFMTHRMFSRNAASSRAIPASKVIEQVENNPAMPIHWGKNQKGMSASEELSEDCIEEVKGDWFNLSRVTSDHAKDMVGFDAHKQIVNRILEPYQFIKVVVTATEWENFFYLRDHKDAQPEIQELARCMKQAINDAECEELKPGQWHTPYVEHCEKPKGGIGYYVVDKDGYDVHLDLEQAIKVSSSCSAQVSFRLLDNSLDKAMFIYDKLVESKPVHASPLEHQATPMTHAIERDGENLSVYINGHMEGATHTDRYGYNWSGNLKGWIQHRQLIKGHVYNG